MPRPMHPSPDPVPMPPPHQPPSPVPPRRHPKWYLLGVLLLVLFAIWLSRGIDPAYNWTGVMDALHVQYGARERYTMMATVGVLICAGLAIARIAGTGRGKH